MSGPCKATTAITCESTEGLAHEDFAGNPLQAVIAMALVSLAALRWRSLSRRSRATVVLVVCSWTLFQVTFRNNPWVSRLETPTYALGALLFVAIPSKRPRRLLGELTGAMAALIAVVGGIQVAIRNESRPLWPAVGRPYPVADYYVNRPFQRVLDDTALSAALRWSCPRLGMYIGEDSYDYPLTWRAMNLGIDARHVSPGDPWPCLVVTDGTVPLPPDAPWEQLGAAMVFRNLAGAAGVGVLGEFEHRMP